MSLNTIRIATRKSPLALWQAEHIQHRLEQLSPDSTVELLPMVTQGDKLLHDNLIKFGGKGLFVKELQKAMLDDKAHLAVHSMKDVPVEFPKGLALRAICQRESPYDALVSNQYDSIDALPEKAIVGTSSLRRACQIKAYRPDIVIKNCRGNVNTRLAKLDKGEFDALLLAESGLKRLGFESRIKQVIDESIMLPAAGQGALGIESRLNNETLNTLLQSLNDKKTALCVNAEREVNRLLGGNCQVPIAVFCTLNDATFSLKAIVGDVANHTLLKAIAKGQNPVSLALEVAKDLIQQGAKTLIEKAYE